MFNIPATAEIMFLAGKNQYFSSGINRHWLAEELPLQPNSTFTTGSDASV